MLSSHWCQSSLFKVSQPSLSQASLRADFFFCRAPSSPKLINWLSWSSFLITFEEVFLDDFLLLEALSADWLPWPQVSHPLVQSSEFGDVKFVDLKPIYGYFGRLWAAEDYASVGYFNYNTPYYILTYLDYLKGLDSFRHLLHFLHYTLYKIR